MRSARAIPALLLLFVPLHASAQPVYEESFDGFDPACIAAGMCGTTPIAFSGATTLEVSTACPVPGACLDFHYIDYDEALLYPFGGGWIPSPEAITISLWLRLDAVYFTGGEFIEGFAQIARAYCDPPDCSLLLEILRESGGGPQLDIQRETIDNERFAIVCSLPIDPTPGWHRVTAHAAWSGTPSMGSCTLGWDTNEVMIPDVTFAAAPAESIRLSHVQVGGSSKIYVPIGSQAEATFDEVCIGADTADCNGDDGGVPMPDGSVSYDGGESPDGGAAREDGGTVSAATGSTFRGGGGCVCSTGTPRGSAPPLGVLAALACILFRARSRRNRA